MEKWEAASIDGFLKRKRIMVTGGRRVIVVFHLFCTATVMMSLIRIRAWNPSKQSQTSLGFKSLDRRHGSWQTIGSHVAWGRQNHPSRHYTCAKPSNKNPCIRHLSSTTPASPLSASTANDFPQAKNKNNEEDEIYQELQWLSKEIRRLDALYYNSMSSESERTDDEFDALVERETFLATKYPHLLEQWQDESGWGVQATRQGRVGIAETEVDETSILQEEPTTIPTQPTTPLRTKRKHLAPMLSLENVHNEEQLWAWLKRIPKVLDEPPQTNGTTRVAIYTEPKLDGVSLSLRYQKMPSTDTCILYQCQWASTRGDGSQGQDVTAAVRSMNHTIPMALKLDPTLIPESLTDVIEIRGEVVLGTADFQSLKEHGDLNITFSNARNAASGILLRKELDDQDEKMEDQLAEAEYLRSKLRFYAYDVVTSSLDGVSSWDGDVVQEFLSQIGFTVPSPVAKTELDLMYNETMEEWSEEAIAPMLNYYRALQAHRENQKETKGYIWGDFEMDGCVHKVSQQSLRRLLGRSMKSPKWAIAHKFPPRAAITNLLDISIQVGRHGALTPVAVLEPVDVAGVTIQRATLHNFGHMQHILGGTELPQGSSVMVRRAGDVIPQVVQRVGDTDSLVGKDHKPLISLKTPERCPACASPVVVDDAASSLDTIIGQVVRCGGPPLLCPPRAVTSLVHAFSRDALDVTGLSESRIQQLMEADLLRFPADMFQFSEEDWEKVQELPGWGKKSSDNLRFATQRVATEGISLGRFIYSLGIRHLGKHSSDLVSSGYRTKNEFFKAVAEAADWKDTDEATEETAETDTPPHGPFAALHTQLGVGPVLIKSLVNFSKSKDLVDAARDLGNTILVLEEGSVASNSADSSAGNDTAQESSDGTRPWAGLRVVFTGSIAGYSRSDAQKVAKQLGARATPGSVSKSTDLVIHGGKGGKKLDQANALGIPTMTGEEFAALVSKLL